MRRLAICSICLFLVSCGGDSDVSVYRAPKEIETPTEKTISWKTPSGWEEKEPSGIRTASFAVLGNAGAAADISLIYLVGKAGGDLNNVNLWREQISLPPITEEQLQKEMVTRKTPLGEAKVVDLVNETRIVASIITVPGGTWFIKMKGDKDLVEKNKPAFVEFLESLSL